MAISNAQQIVNVDRMNDGIIIKFEDGKCAFYSSALLYATLPHSKKLEEMELDW